jgi:UrcA family protein
MFCRVFGARRSSLFVALALSIIAIAPAGAEPSREAGRSSEEIAVVAPRTIERKTVGRSVHGARIEEVSLSRRVSYADLDLSRSADVAELDKRIARTAKEACAELSTLLPLEYGRSAATDRACARKAVRAAEGQKQQAVERVRG